MARYGLPASFYGNLLQYLVNPTLHDFRLAELPSVTGDPLIGQRTLSMLDLGCGPGTLVLRALAAGHDAWGVDLWDEKIELARMRVDAYGYPQAWKERLRIENAGNLPFEDQQFDLVTSYHVVEHVSDLRSVLYEAVRVTKRGGWIELRAPDYRMSYDTHYCMPWPRLMPPQQAHRWVEAMERPADGIGTFYYVTGPEVIALLTSLGCRVQTVLYREHRDDRIWPHSGSLTPDPIVFRSDRDVTALAAELNRLKAAGRLPNIYKTCLEFTIAAQRL